MEYIGKFISNFRELYNGINAATLTGAIDVVIVQQEDGTYLSSPFHVRFGKLGVLRSREKVVDIEINGDPVDIHMKLGESGEAFFVSESPIQASDTMTMPAYMATSPIPPSIIEEKMRPTANTSEASSITAATSLSAHEPASELAADTLMGNRDEGMLGSATEDHIIIGSKPPAVFKAETVVAGQVECTFQPIEPDQQVQSSQQPTEPADLAESLPDSLATDDGRRSARKKSRKRRNNKRPNNRSKHTHKYSESSADADADVNIDDNDEEPDDVILDDTPPQGDAKLGHRKSNSIAGIPIIIQNNQQIATASDPVSDWVNSDMMMSRSLGPEFHFFSDTEVEMRSPDGSRPPTPVHSDTEYEVELKRPKGSQLESSAQCQPQTWRWGELPNPPVPMNRPSPPKTTSRPASRDVSPVKHLSAQDGSNRKPEASTRPETRPVKTPEEEEAQHSMMSQVLSFMRRNNKKMRSQAAIASGGIYLDTLDVESLDPELAALYITQSSFRQGLQGSNANNASSRLREEDTESGKGPSLPQSPHSLSSATGANIRELSGPRSVDSDFEDSRADPHHPRGLPDVALSLCGSFADGQIDPPEELFLQSLVTYDDFAENPRLVENPDLLVRIGSKYYTWQAACPIIMSWALYQRVLPPSTVESLVQQYGPKRGPLQKKTESKPIPQPAPAQRSSWLSWVTGAKKPTDPAGSGATTTTQPATSTSTVVPTTMQAAATPAVPIHQPSNEMPLTGTSSDNESNDSTAADEGKKLPRERRSYYDNTNVYCKTLRLSSEQIGMLHLREGPNEAVFSVTTAYQGTTRCKCHIYLWRYDDKIVISDIDGTITKSDVLGHILPIVGQDWAQMGVAQLFTKIKNNGYRILYLSARAIGQAHITREYLRSVRQGDLSLPDGPLLLNPTSLLSALHREVIEKKPEEFKISCLRDIQCLFPSDSNPFYAGYGNRVNDVWAYTAVGIPTSRIFTINPKGELKLELTQSVQSSYSKQSLLVDLVFPPFTHDGIEGAEFNEFTYWRQPVAALPEDANKFITADVVDAASSQKRRPSPVGDKK